MVIKLSAAIERFDNYAEKTGWMYIRIPSEIASKLNPGNKKSFRIRGKIDAYEFSQTALLPMGEGAYILPVNKVIRNATKKKDGDKVNLEIEADKTDFTLNQDMMLCLAGESDALQKFMSLSKSHQKYFSNWIDTAKTIDTKADRINKTLFAIKNDMDYGQMIRHFRDKKV